MKKNIWVVHTDQPSRLGYLTKKGKEVFKDLRLFDKPMPNILDSENQNIYITSDEEIQEGDYGFDEVHKCVVKITKELINNYLFKKIILTTDLKLVKDGVQAIDDVFLEWFVKNPGCVFVEIKHYNNQCRGECGICDNSCGDFYKIIIPQEQPKQETLEEVCDKVLNYLYPNCKKEMSNLQYTNSIISLKYIAKWQANRMYNKEEVDKLLDVLLEENMCSQAGDELIEEFKKNNN